MPQTLTRGLVSGLAIGLTGVTEVSASPSPPPPPPPATTQTADFGALTLTSAGGFKPIDSNNAEVNLTAITDSGTGTRTWSISSGALVANGTPGVDDGRVLVCTGSDANTYTITINSQADTYSVRSVAEMEAVNALGASTLDNKTMRLRPGQYDVFGSTTWLSNKSFTNGFTIASHDTRAFTGIYDQLGNAQVSASHERVKLVTKSGTSNTNLAGLSRVTFDGICIEGRYDRRVDGSTTYALRYDGTVDYATYRYVWFKGDSDSLGPGPNFRGLIGGNGNYAAQNILFEHSRFSYTGRCINYPGDNTIVRFCQFDNYSADGMILGNLITVQQNLFFAAGGDPTDPSNTNDTRVAYESAITGVTNSQQGLFYFRFRPEGSTTSARQALWVAMQSNSTERAALEITSGGKVRFWAADSGGTTRIDMTSTLDAQQGCQHNAIISVDSTGTSRMYLWIEGGSSTRSSEEETVTDTAGSETLNWATAQGMSLWASDDGTNSGTDNYDGALSAFAFWPGQTADVTSEAVRDAFFDDDSAWGPYKALPTGTYGTPPVDLRGDLFLWRRSIGHNNGTGESFVMQTSGSQDLDTSHIDVLQGIRTGPTLTKDTSKDSTDVKLLGNIFVAVFPDGTPDGNGGSQGFFGEDITAMYNYNNFRAEGNLLIGSAAHGITWYNVHNGYMLHNTVITPSAFNTEGFAINTYRVRALVHGNYQPGWTIDVDGKTGTILAGDYVSDPGGNWAIVWDIEAQDATTATLRLLNTSADGGGAVLGNDFDFDDNDGLTFSGSGATATCNGDMYWQLPRAFSRLSNMLEGNISASANNTFGTSEGVAYSYAHPFLTGELGDQGDNYGYESEGSIDDQLAVIFANGSTSFTGLTDLPSILARFATNTSLRTGRELKYGWDAYPLGESPAEGTCTSFSVTDLTDQAVNEVVESAAVAPSGISQYGCTLWAKLDDGTRQEVQILASDGTTVIEDWTVEKVVIQAGERFKVRRTSAGFNSTTQSDFTVYCGDQSDAWQVTTRAETVYLLDEFASDTTSEWSESGAGVLTYDATNDRLEINQLFSFPSIERTYVDADSEVLIAIPNATDLSLQIDFTEVSGSGGISWKIGHGSNQNAYVSDARDGDTPFQLDITTSQAGSLFIQIKPRGVASSRITGIDQIKLFTP